MMCAGSVEPSVIGAGTAHSSTQLTCHKPAVTKTSSSPKCPLQPCQGSQQQGLRDRSTLAKSIECEQEFYSDKCLDECDFACPNLREKREFEIEQNNQVKKVSVKGRLQKHKQFWQDIGANQWVMDCILEGYKIPFKYFPLPAKFRNNKSAFTHSEFVTKSVLELLADNRIRQVDEHCTFGCKSLISRG